MKNWIRRIVEQKKGYLFGPGSVPKGVDVFRDMERYGYVPWLKMAFDVGANTGQFATALLRNCPQIDLFCFEPVRSTFDELKRNVGSLPSVKVFCHAMGAAQGEVAMTSRPGWVMNRVLAAGERPPVETATERVVMQTIDSISEQYAVAEIGLLKTDTEGFDLQVLRGAQRMIAGGKVFLVWVEVGFSNTDKGHTFFSDVRDLLADFDIVGFYNQGSDGNFSALDRADVLFVHRGLAGERFGLRWSKE